MNRRTVACATVLALAVVAPASHALDLAEALRDVAAAHPALIASRERAVAARARIGPAGAWNPPMLELGVTNVPTNGAFDMDPMTMKMIGVAQRLPLSGANGLTRRAAREAASAAGADVRASWFALAGDAMAAYADAYFADALVRRADAHRGTMESLVSAARARYAAGGGRLDDVLAAETERARVRVDLAGWRGEARAARTRLDRLRGREPGDTADSLAPPPVDDASDDAWRASLGAAHPRLAAADAEARRWEFAARAARRMLAVPDVEVRASYGRRSPLADGTPQDDMFSVTGAIMLPVFAGSRERAEAAEMDAMARAAAADRRDAELELRDGLERALAEREALQAQAALLADTVLVAQRAAVETARRAWSAGLGDLARVLDAEHAAYTEEVSILRARQQLARTTATLVSLTGRLELVVRGDVPAPGDQP